MCVMRVQFVFLIPLVWCWRGGEVSRYSVEAGEEKKEKKESVCEATGAVSAVRGPTRTHNTSHPRLTRNVGGFGCCRQKNNKTR
jgi:hypothetical protein